jgi:hypothetical protein
MQDFLKLMPWLALMCLALISTPRNADTQPAERHPHIRAAVRQLRQARRELQEANHDFCGHRAEAVKITDSALQQLQAALECDRK